ncbi:MAG: SLC13 family permease [Gammaproteobacteria bacterium]|nr:SLC13 family permease [Gammaproteobacteria bacterium]
MTFDAWFSIAIMIFCFSTLVLSHISPDIIMSAGLTLLLVFGILDPQEALAGFSNEGMLTVAVLYIVVAGLTETGAVGWIVQSLLGRPRSMPQAQFRLMLPVSILSAFLNNTPVVAIFIPAVKDWAKAHRLTISKLMIPLSYASIAGGTCTLIGTSTNLVVNGMLQEQNINFGLSMFELLWIGAPIVIVVFTFLLIFSRWLLPERTPALNRNNDVRQYTVEMKVDMNGALEGKSIENAGLRQLPGLFLIEIERAEQIIPAVSPQEIIRSNDRLTFAGDIDSVIDLQKIRGLTPATRQIFKLDSKRSDRSFVEAVVSNTCPMIGKTIQKGRFRSRYNAVIIAIARNGKQLKQKIGDIKLLPGDTLLLETRASFMQQQHNSRDFFLISEIGNSHPLDHKRAPIALGIVVLMIIAVSFAWLSMLKASLLAAGLMIITRCLDGRAARLAPDWQILVVIATAFGIGAAVHKTGAATIIAETLTSLTYGDPWLTLAMVFLLTAGFTAMATNNVAAVLMFPIALEAANTLQVSIMPFAITIMVAASASFSTPIGYQTNLMVFNAGGYRFKDFFRVGFPLTILVGLVTLLITPLIWKF